MTTLIFCLFLAGLLVSACQAWAVSTSYIDDDGQTQTADATPLTGSETELSGGWYVVNSNITYDHTLRIFGQSKGTGTLSRCTAGL